MHENHGLKVIFSTAFVVSVTLGTLDLIKGCNNLSRLIATDHDEEGIDDKRQKGMSLNKK